MSNAGANSGERVEAMLYSDAHVTGEVTEGLGPYRLLNALADPRGDLRPGIVLRAEICLEAEADMSRTDESGYHGADVFEELAALLSLSLGIRCRSGGRTRMWSLAGDPLGRPVEFDHRPPYLPMPGTRGPVIPTLARTVDLTAAVPLLQGYCAASIDSAPAMLRAARLYQQAIWVADSDPNQAWVQLVSAIETAAELEAPAGASARDRLREAWPELASLIEQCGEDNAEAVARSVAPVVKSQWRFLRFMERFLPPPPSERPYEWAQVDWSAMPDHLRSVYAYRSRTLHLGTPFPQPMCEPPHRLNDGVPAERPIGLATQLNDSTWVAKDTPLLLATFEYIARGALQQWWMETPRGTLRRISKGGSRVD